MKRLIRFWNTVRYLKTRQILYQLYYRFKRYFPIKNNGYQKFLNCSTHFLETSLYPEAAQSKVEFENTFNLLNLKKEFGNFIQWNDMSNGKLWNYHLQYLDFLHQNSLSVEERVQVLNDISKCIIQNDLLLEPYPTSLRLMNSISFVSKYKINELHIQQAIKIQVHYLLNNREYHIDGNHLFENAIALRMAAEFLDHSGIKKNADKLLIECLGEQILKDGAHYERSLMYHTILLMRLMILYDLLNQNSRLKDKILECIHRMFSFYNTITNEQKVYPFLQDSTGKMDSERNYIQRQSIRWALQNEIIPLKESGYRIIKTKNIFLVMNVGNVSPKFQPGHTHADMLSFVLYINNQPIIVHPGISTYEKNDRRILERSTFMHNTVEINGKNQSDIWGGFRMGSRSRIKILADALNKIEAIVTNYAGHSSWSHKRIIEFNDQELLIEDIVEAPDAIECIMNLHFNYNIQLQYNRDIIKVNEHNLKFENYLKFEILPYLQSLEFNKMENSNKLETRFRNKLITRLYV